MKIFVTGGAGFIGCNFIRHVLGARRHYEIVNYDKLTYAGNLANLESVAENQNYRFVRGDICDAASVEAAMDGCDAVVHFAAESHVDRSIYEPAPVIETNVTGTFILLQIARKVSVSRLYSFPRTRFTAIFSPASSPTKILHYSRAAHILLRRPVRIYLSGPTCARTDFPH